jgi:hypothetical protein
MFDQNRSDALFLRAERRSDGVRTFKLLPGAPLETSFGEDLYREVFEHSVAASGEVPQSTSRPQPLVSVAEPAQ